MVKLQTEDVIMRKGYYSLIIICLLAVFSMPTGVVAQWSADPMQNLGIAVADGDQALPKIEATSDGGCYISWFDNRSGSYCVYMQRLNALGEAQWAPNGMLISDHPQMSWLVDYDMTVDQNDNAVVVFSDMRNGTSNDIDVFAYKIGPDGSFLWGPDGICLSENINSDFEPAAKVTATSVGNFVFSWQRSAATDILGFQKLSSDGQKMWGETGFTISGAQDHNLSAPDLAPAEGDLAIVIWKDSTGPFWAPTTELYTQKFDAFGNPIWTPSGVLIYNLGSISAWTYPEILSDQNGGAFYTWYDSPSLAEFNVWVQHVDAAGNLVLPLNGIQASTYSTDRLHMNPSLSYVPASDDLFVFWVETNGGQTQYGVYGQKFSPIGDRLWTDSGMEFMGLGNDQISFVGSGTAENSLYVCYFQSPSTLSTAVKAFRINLDGNMFWNPCLLSSETLGNKDDLLMVVNTENRAFCTWDDARNDIGDIFAQNVNPDGSLGNQAASPVTVNLTPLNPPIQIPASGGTFDFNVAIANTGVNPETFDFWTMVTLPNSAEYGPIINVPDFTAPAGWSGDRDRTQAVPGNAPAGMYTYDAYAGVYPDEVWTEDHFDFEKLTDGDGSDLFTGWTCCGKEFDEFAAALSTSPDEFGLLSAYPNPFNPSTVLSYKLQDASYVTLTVYDVAGRKAAELVNGWSDMGVHEVVFDGSGLTSGIYFYCLEANDFTASGKMVLMK
jgi:hypothetical protein